MVTVSEVRTRRLLFVALLLWLTWPCDREMMMREIMVVDDGSCIYRCLWCRGVDETVVAAIDKDAIVEYCYFDSHIVNLFLRSFVVIVQHERKNATAFASFRTCQDCITLVQIGTNWSRLRSQLSTRRSSP